MNEADQQERLRKIAERVTDIPTLPGVMTKMIEMLDDPGTTAPQLARFIAFDQAFTVKILKLANSAFYGLPRKVATIEMALLVLGLDEVKNLGLTISVVDAFKDREYYSFFDMREFWRHSVGVAAGCKVLAVSEKTKMPAGDLFVAGLLHDIGTLVMCRHLTREFSQVMDQVRAGGGVTQTDAEFKTIGFTHADVGGWLTKSWNFPVHLVSAIANHHTPTTSFLKPNLALSVCFANNLAWRSRLGSGVGRFDVESDRKLFELLELRRLDDGAINWAFYIERLEHEMVNAEDYLSVLHEN